ncbi:MAG: hypothetical protein M3036_03575, partial [Bifidobacteriales bacterium]|nr:hypothetical protein [Bifidobacteriales bacterium]
MSYKTVGLWGLVVGSSVASTPLWAAESSHYAPVGRGKSDAQHPSSKVTKANLKQQHPPQETIIVKARRRERMEVQLGGQAGVLGTKKGLDLPFNLRSYTSSMILNQQSQTLGQV